MQTSILEQVRGAVSQECYQIWFKDLSILGIEGSVVRVSVPNRYTKHWLETHYKKEILRAVAALMPEVKSVELLVQSSVRVDTDPAVTLSRALENSIPAALHSSARNENQNFNPSPSRPEVIRQLPLSHRLRLDTFLAGKSNRVAHAAAQSVGESPASVYNPLFIHGAHGLGKTHLLQGISHLLIERSPPLNVIYLSCEEFANAYIGAVQNKRLDAFRSRMRSCDALVIDDIQFLGGKERTQEEFLYTFDALRQAHKQIVISADAAPKEIKRLDGKLIARLCSGLVARLESPEPALRVALIQDKARERALHLAPDVTELLASHIENNVRELEGAVCKLMALAAAEQKAPDRELAMLAMRELGYLRSGPLTLQDILSAVSERFHCTADDLRSSKRHAGLVRARHIGMFLSKILTSQSVADIGRFYGNRDHATVLHATKKMSELLKRDDVIKDDIHGLRQVLGR